MKTYFSPEALLDNGWARDVSIEVADDGNIVSVKSGKANSAAEYLGGAVIPGMPSVHTHAFQRAMAGLAERMGSPEDSFWTWREVMYSFIKRIGPEDALAIAAQLYVEMLKNGYTAVAEFHYLHHSPEGKPYARRSEMAQAMGRAAQSTGMAITLLPSLYAYGNFGAAPIESGQKRFASSPELILSMLQELRAAFPAKDDFRLGVAPHSLRAVSPAMLRDLLAGLEAIDPHAPIHMHVAEQVKEVNDCLSWSDQRPVQWLLDNMPVDERWCLVHCTHVSMTEAEHLAHSGAVTGLCPTTEGNLGDGIFPFLRYREKGGRYAIGTDSNVSRSPVEELRWLEYVQRLSLRRRNITATPSHPSVGTNLWRGAASGGAQALGRKMGAIAPGLRADLVVLDDTHVDLADRHGETLMDAYLFNCAGGAIKQVMVGGKWVVRDGRHFDQAAIEARYRGIQKKLLA
ncbi:MAG: formimidoylglutamate deiminase [Burkholderiales bacterium]